MLEPSADETALLRTRPDVGAGAQSPEAAGSGTWLLRLVRGLSSAFCRVAPGGTPPLEESRSAIGEAVGRGAVCRPGIGRCGGRRSPRAAHSVELLSYDAGLGLAPRAGPRLAPRARAGKAAGASRRAEIVIWGCACG